MKSIQWQLDERAPHGGTVTLPAGTHILTEPLRMASGVSLRGVNQSATTLKCEHGPAVVVAENCNRFSVSDLRLIGNRNGTNATNDGLYLKDCSYFDVCNVRVQMASRGVRLKTCWCGSLTGAVAERCQGYGFDLSDSCTSLVLSQTVAWGTGGGWKFVGCVYCTLLSPACDHCCAGGTPDDPFGSHGSGGNYLAPQHVFYVAASSLSLVSPGTENGYAPWLYAEGAKLSVANPYVYNLQCHAAPWRFIELRGTAWSDVEITNPHFVDVVNKVGVDYRRCGLFVENHEFQRLVFNRLPELGVSWGQYKLSRQGIHVLNTTEIGEA